MSERRVEKTRVVKRGSREETEGGGWRIKCQDSILATCRAADGAWRTQRRETIRMRQAQLVLQLIVPGALADKEGEFTGLGFVFG
jgi:hypothetical protein